MEWLTVVTAILTLAMVLVIVLDTTTYIIPNTLNLALIVVYAFAAYLLALAWPMALVAAAIVLAIGLGIFALGLMGGGDIKLLVALTLWTGWHIATVHFLLYTTLFGGVLVIVVLLARALLAPLWTGLSKRNLPRILTRKQSVPYGIAIALAFLCMLYTGEVPGLAP